MKLVKIIGLVVLVAALGAGLVLMQRNQEMRRGAAYAEIEALFLPDVKSVDVGEVFTSTFLLDTKTHKLTGVDVKIKYDNSRLEVVGVKPVVVEGAADAGKKLFKAESDVLDKAIDKEKGTINLAGISMEEDATKMATGAVSLVKIDFKAIAAGMAEVTLDGSYQNMATGYNPSSSDQSLAIKTIKKASYTVKGSSAVTPRPSTVTSVPTKEVKLQLTKGGATEIGVGQVLLVGVEVNSGINKLSAVDMKVTYDPALLEMAAISINENVFNSVLRKDNDAIKGEIELYVVSNLPKERLSTGTVTMAKLNFRAKKLGQGTIKIDSGYKTEVVGISSTGVSKSFSVEYGSGLSYKVGSGATPTGTAGCNSDADCRDGQKCYQPPMPTCPVGMGCIQVMPPKRCIPVTTPTLVISTTPVPTGFLSCKWCGSSCVSSNLKMMCPDVMPAPGLKCVAKNGQCVIIGTTPTPVISIRPTIVPTGSLGCGQRCTINTKCGNGLTCVPIWWPSPCGEIPSPLLDKTNNNQALSTSDVSTAVRICPEVKNALLPESERDKINTDGSVRVSIAPIAPPAMIGVCRNPRCTTDTDCVCGGMVTPTPRICKVGVNSFSTNTACSGDGFRYATYECYDGYRGTMGGTTSCKPASLWREYVESECRGRSSCGVVTPTLRPTTTPCPMVPVGCVRTTCATETNAPGCCPIICPSGTPVVTGVARCSCPAGVPAKREGNSNCDSRVDLSDFEAWRSEAFDQGGIEGKMRTDWKADFNCDQKVNLSDFEMWRVIYFK